MHGISIHVLIQQNEYQFIDISIYHCVLINECNGQNFEIDILRKIIVRKTLYSVVIVIDLYLKKLYLIAFS